MRDDLTPFERYLAQTIEGQPVPPMSTTTSRRPRAAMPFLRGRLAVLALSATAVLGAAGGTAAVVATAAHIVTTPRVPTATAGPSATAVATAAATTSTVAPGVPVAPPPTHAPGATAAPLPPAVSATPPSPTQTPAAPAARSIVSAFTDTPGTFVNNGSNSTMIKFTLTNDATVNVDVLNSSGGVVCHVLTNESKAAGNRYQGYYGYNGSGHLLPPGTYTLRIVATSTTGSGTATTTLVLKSN